MPKITLKSVVDSLNDVPEAYRGRYTEGEDKKFHLDEIEIDDGAELRTALEREREARRTANKEIERLKGDYERYKDIDPDKAREALQALADAEEKKLKDKGKFEELLAAERDKAQKALDAKIKEIEARDATIAERDRALRKFQLDDKVRAAALHAGVLADDIEDVMTLTASRFDLSQEGQVVVLGADGKDSGSSLEDFFGKQFKEQKPKFYAPTGGSGSGSPAGGAAGGSSKKSVKRQEFEQMGAQERMTFFKEGGKVED
jgi:hypothetical protein